MPTAAARKDFDRPADSLDFLRRGALPRTPLYLALFASLLLNYWIPPAAVLGAGTVAGVAMAMFYALPLLFAGLIFASTIRMREGGLAPALASNLVGSVLGGVLENAAMTLGFSALSLLAIGVYAASLRR